VSGIERQQFMLNLNPLVVVVDDVFDEDLANHLITKGDGTFQPGAVVDASGGSKLSESRTNEHARVDQWADPRVTQLVSEISAIVRLPPENTEPCTLLRYQGDQKFDVHSDAFDQTPGGRQFIAQGGQRLFTTICYLNNVKEGGETEFPFLKIKVKPKRGRVLIFGNTRLGTIESHPHSEHAGRSVKGGEKYVLSMWWRQLAYHVQREYPAESGETKVVE
jgi:prolyl 4-hydroxylase